MTMTSLTKVLDEHQVRYVTLRHSTAYTAQEVAQSAHISGKEVAKTVMVKLDGVMSMAVLRATDKVDLDLLRGAAEAKEAKLAEEDEFRGMFPDVEVGAMPPFGNLYDMPVFVDTALSEDRRIAFNAGTHKDLIQLEYEAYAKIVKPKVASFASD